jgi:hypothetical protein
MKKNRLYHAALGAAVLFLFGAGFWGAPDAAVKLMLCVGGLAGFVGGFLGTAALVARLTDNVASGVFRVGLLLAAANLGAMHWLVLPAIEVLSSLPSTILMLCLVAVFAATLGIPAGAYQVRYVDRWRMLRP